MASVSSRLQKELSNVKSQISKWREKVKSLEGDANQLESVIRRLGKAS